MNPTLETVLYSSPTVAFNVNSLSRKMAPKDMLFHNSSMNNTIIFKYPNFDVSEGGIVENIGSHGGRGNSVHTAIFIPRNADDLLAGGFGAFMDDDNLSEILHQYLGLDPDDEGSVHDMKILNLLKNIPSLDPYLLEDCFSEAKLDVNQAYFDISSDERSFVRNMITEKVKPIVFKALGVDDGAKINTQLTKFIDAIWDTSMHETEVFINAFGIKKDQVNEVFGAWKGITFYLHEFLERRDRIVSLHEWLQSKNSLPADYGRLKTAEKQQVDMFRKDVGNSIALVQNNAHEIFNVYDHSYQNFIENNEPKYFRDFLFKAHDYYWTLGACNGVLSQVCTTWERYYHNSKKTNYRLNNEVLIRMLRVCDALLKSHAGTHIGHL